MNRDFPLAATPDAVTEKKGPNRTVVKTTFIGKNGSKKVVKQVDSKRGSKIVLRVNGKRTQSAKTY